MKGRRIIAVTLGIVCILIIFVVLLLTLFFQEHHGLPLSHKEVKELTQKAERGDREACYRLSVYYVEDEQKTLYWLRKGAAYGDPRAEYGLYGILKKQPGSQEEAIELLKKAAVQEYEFAQWVLGRSYRDGDIVVRDLKQAKYWFRRAANNGETSAMLDLSKLLTEMHKDKVGLSEAYKWSALALSQSDQKSVFANEVRQQQIAIIEKAKGLGFDKFTLSGKKE